MSSDFVIGLGLGGLIVLLLVLVNKVLVERYTRLNKERKK